MHKGHRTLMKLLLVELHTLDLLRKISYIWNSRVRISTAPSTVFKIIIGNLQ